MKEKRLFRWLVTMGLVMTLFLALVPSAAALKTMNESDIVIGANQVIDDDLVASANTFTLDGTVKGDLIVGASVIEINGTVEGDLIAGGQSVIVNGTIKDDVRIAGAAMTLGENAQITDDIIALGYSLEARPGSLINGSLYFAGAQSRLAGSVAENVWVDAGGLELLGEVGGDVQASVDTPVDAPTVSPFAFMPNMPDIPAFTWGLTVGEEASIGGDLNYTSTREFGVPVGSVIGRVTSQLVQRTETEEVITPASQTSQWLLEQLRQLIALLLVGLLMVWLVPFWMNRVTHALADRPWAGLGWGIVSIPVVIVAFLVILGVMILAAMALGALTLSNLVGTVIVIGLLVLFALAVAFSLVVAYVTKVTVSLLGGRLILSRLAPNQAESRVWPLVVGLLVLAILTAIPWVGGWINLAVVLLGLGALWLRGQEYLQQRRVTTEPIVPKEPTMKPA